MESIESAVKKELYEQVVPGLSDFIRVPNLSREFDPEWKTNGLLQRAAQEIIDWVTRQNLRGVRQMRVVQQDENTPPFLLIEIDGTDAANAPTVMVYGHFDKQPHKEGWREGLAPTKPVIENGWLYGRGGGDDGYCVYSVVSCVKVLQALNIPHPRFVFTIEGDEETESYYYMEYLEQLKDVIGTPQLILCSDSGTMDYDTFWLTTNLRGCINGNLTARVLQIEKHSGEASGVVPSSFRILRQILDKLEDSKTGRVLDDFQVQVPEQRLQEVAAVAEFIGPKYFEQFKFFGGTQPMTNDVREAILNQTWRPALSYTGVEGIPCIEQAGNVLRTHTTLKLSLRTPPTLDSKKAALRLKEILEADPPYGATVTYEFNEPGNGWNAPPLKDFLMNSIHTSSQKYFGREAKFFGEGGSIPLMNALLEKYPQAQYIVSGVLGPNSNAHAPNEGFPLDYLEKVMCCYTQIFADLQANANRL